MSTSEGMVFEKGSPQWKKLRKLCTESVPGKRSALYTLNDLVLGKGPLVPMTYRAHLGMCLFAEGMTGIPEIDEARVKLILVSRGIGKTSLVTKGLPILRVLQNPNYASGIANEVAEMAESFLGDIKAEFQNNELLKALFPEVIPDDFRATTWRSDRIITKRDKQNPSSPTVIATGVGGTKTGIHQDCWVCDDLLSKNAAEALQRGITSETESTNRWITQLQPLLKNPKRDPLVFIGCIEASQPVLMADGTWKPISLVQAGDKVWACKKDGSEGFAPREVTKVWNQGRAEVVEINAAGRKLLCTEDHPILGSWGRSDGVGRKWKTSKDFYNPKRHQNLVEVFERQDVSLEVKDLEWAWLMGFMLGDGWNTKTDRIYLNAQGEVRNNGTTYSPGFSPGVDDALNQKVIALFKKFFGAKPFKALPNSYRLDSTKAGKMFEASGLTPKVGAKDKTIPEWVYVSSLEERREFLKGLCDADGHWNHQNRAALEMSSKKMVHEVHKLAMSCGVRPSSITYRKRTIQPPNSPKPVEAESWCVALNFLERSKATHRYSVKSVQNVSEERDVWDLTIEDGDCAFVCNGFIVGNTIWWEGDSYAFIEDFFGHGEEPTKHLWTLRLPAQHTTWTDGGEEKIIQRPPETQQLMLTRRGEVAIFRLPARDETGRAVFPERYNEEELRVMEEEDPVFFAGQYLLEPTAGAASFFQKEWLNEYDWDGKSLRFTNRDGRIEHIPLRELTTLISVDPAFSKKASAARTAIPVTGLDGERIFLLEDTAERMDSEDDIASKVASAYIRYPQSKIFVETIVAQVAVANAIRRRFRELNLGEPPLVEIPTHGKQNKNLRVFGMEHYFKRGLFYYHRSHTNFLREFMSFPRAALKDILDALSFQKDEWEKIFNVTHFTGAHTQEDRRRLEQGAIDRIKRARSRRQGRRRV